MDIICTQACWLVVTSEPRQTYLSVVTDALPPPEPFSWRRVYQLGVGDKIVFTEIAHDDTPYHKLLTMYPEHFAEMQGEAQ